MENKYLYLIAGAVLAYFWFRRSQSKKALAAVNAGSPPVSGFAGPMAAAKTGQETSPAHILAQRRFAPPAAGAVRFGQTASGGMHVQTNAEGLSPPGSFRTVKRKY